MWSFCNGRYEKTFQLRSRRRIGNKIFDFKCNKLTFPCFKNIDSRFDVWQRYELNFIEVRLCEYFVSKFSFNVCYTCYIQASDSDLNKNEGRLFSLQMEFLSNGYRIYNLYSWEHDCWSSLFRVKYLQRVIKLELVIILIYLFASSCRFNFNLEAPRLYLMVQPVYNKLQ